MAESAREGSAFSASLPPLSPTPFHTRPTSSTSHLFPHALRILCLPTDYYILSRRHLCAKCHVKRNIEREQIIQGMIARGIDGYKPSRAEYKTPGYTFTTSSPACCRLLPAGRGGMFPAFLLHRCVG